MPQEITMKHRLLFYKNKLMILLGVFGLLFLASSFINSLNHEPAKLFVVVLDAGHGGKDSGNIGNGFREKEIALDVSLQVGEILSAEPNIKVIYTRKTDVFIELDERAPVANKADADLFVSIHCNAHHTQAQGAETFVMGLSKSEKNLNTAKKENEVIFLEENYQERYKGFDTNSPESLIGLTLLQEEYLDQSIQLAGLIQNNFVSHLKRKDRSVKQDVFWVLHHSYMPSVLIELGFLTHNTEGPYINSKKGRKEMAQEIARGILTYKQELDLTLQSNDVVPQSQAQESSVVKDSDVVFKVQIAASGKKLALEPYNFKGLTEITRVKEKELYRYYYGQTNDYNVIESLRQEALIKGYKGAYIVAFKGGERVALDEVLNK